MKRVRCAIYTRKSSEEGLEQDFNSLDAQREACAAYVLSQASEGWQLIPENYDDGGLSGGTLERPALQRLLADVAEGRIDIIVVYKVDRLSRSLFDFAKLVEAFEKTGTSFVSVTQSFNTTTSMGRLTLNMLLSFAQFEREVTAERIRDKLAASKAKGMWMGGTPPIGYRADGRSLAIVDAEAATVRTIYARYRELGTVRLLADWLSERKIRSPLRTTGTGRTYGNAPFSRGQLYRILRSPIYAGDIPHKDKVYPGNHAAIIDRETWDAVQRQLDDHVQGDGTRVRAVAPSLLAGLIVDASGQPLQAAHTSKKSAAGNVRYRYYVSGTEQHSLRIPAREIEQVVAQETARLFDDAFNLADRAGLDLASTNLRQLEDTCTDIAHNLRKRSPEPLRTLVTRVQVVDDRIVISLDANAISAALSMPQVGEAPSSIDIAVPSRLTRTGRALRLVNVDRMAADNPEADPGLVAILARGRRWWGVLAQGEITIDELSKIEAVTASYMTRTVRLAFMAPDVVAAALEGRLKAGITGRSVINAGALPESWPQQRREFLPA